MRRSGIQAEVVLSLGLVMLAATAVLVAVLWRHGEMRLRDVLGRALWSEARMAPAPDRALVPGTRWWRVLADGRVEPPRLHADEIDAATLRLAEQARSVGSPLLLPGPPWQAIRFATPDQRRDEVLVARLPRPASVRLRAAPLGVAFGVLLVDVAIFTAFGTYLLRRRVLGPLERLAASTRALAEGELGVRVAVEGPHETAELASAFNQMSEALARRTGALEKAVAELREANHRVRTARAGLARAERLAAVGRLAAGVAHEIGNPIAAQLAFLELTRRDPGLGEGGREHLARAEEQGQRVRRILRQLLEFSRPPRPAEPVALDRAALAEQTVALVRAQRRYRHVAFEVRREGEPPTGRGDAGAVSQILLNLVLNAAEAAGHAEAGKVTLILRPGTLELRAGDPPEAVASRRTPDAVECWVLDDGPGVPEEDRERIFDPFFTTRAPGEGTGLGLSTALRMAEELGGQLELAEAPPPHRTALVLRLPCARSAASDARA